ncbi:MAG: alpha/beta fold hydrolase [Actinomycetota bacterium]
MLRSNRPPSSLIRAIALAVAALLVAAACTGGGDGAAPESPEGPELKVRPTGLGVSGGGVEVASDVLERIRSTTFESSPCEFELPDAATPECGTVTVPMNWETGEGEVILSVAVFSSLAPEPAADPVVYLEGGPGGHALDTLYLSADDLLEPLLERGDAVFFDQRGSGLSVPRLACPALTEYSRVVEDDPTIADDEIDARYSEIISTCAADLTAGGVDIASFTSIQNAHDVEAIRVALGYGRWNLYGISYGTRLGLEVLRQHPAGVRAAVLDSVYPPQVDSVAENPATFLDSFDAVVAACATEPACAADGDLAERFRALAAELDANPVNVEITADWATGETDTVWADGSTLVTLMLGSLYSPYQFTDLPELVDQLEAGETAALSDYLSSDRNNEPFSTSGALYAFECNEEVAFSDRDVVAAAVPADPFELQESFEYFGNLGESAFDLCEAFAGWQPSEPYANESVVSSVPTLLMAGRFDPVTPVSWAEQAGETLDRSQLVVAPFDSHGVSPGECGMTVLKAFLDQPGEPVDAACFDDESIAFLSAPEAPSLEPFSYDSGFHTVSSVRPEGWTIGGLDGDSYRGDSILDSAALLQLDADVISMPGLEGFVESVFRVSFGPEEAVTGPDGRAWTRRTGEGVSSAGELWTGEIDGANLIVLFVAPNEQFVDLSAQVLDPALATITAEPS